MKLFGNIQNSAIFTFQPEDHQKRYTKVWSQIPAEHSAFLLQQVITYLKIYRKLKVVV